MDGFKRRLKKSIRFRLSVFLSVAIVSISALLAIFSLKFAYEEAHELQDDTLHEITLHFSPTHLPFVERAKQRTNDPEDPETKVIVQYRNNSGEVFKSAADSNLFLVHLTDGFQTVRVNNTQYRVFARTLKDGTQIAVAQDTSVRDEIAGDSALRTLMPAVLLIPVLLYLVADIIGKLFVPLQRLADELDQRSPGDMDPMDDDLLPDEIHPFGTAINRQFARIKKGMETQRQFIADAAHELRSPLTALSLQMELVDATELKPESAQRFKKMQEGLERTRKLLEQLLELARTESNSEEKRPQTPLKQTLRRVLEECMYTATLKRIDLGAEGNLDIELPLSELQLFTLLRNLIDNAVRYTPVGGKVTIQSCMTDTGPMLEVIDNGPGIAQTEQQRVFDSFYRILGSGETGSGLGLAIVKKIMENSNGTIELISPNSDQKNGLTVKLTFTNTQGTA
ncbi:ATP-binding protein [Limnobacter litoralis]|uniref:histidine kinase n=1 Tax=Limnobacter litoralis TaxID=481366 RepID=A0ABQ5YMY4_9BURK|nr:ATP-binding protein [Limnobacter litoralis]GLR25938.1 two-component sensor histidine kinase [Limnobacter litoralis]